MILDLTPLAIALVGLVLYTVLAGADFGAGFWQLLAGPVRTAARSATTRTAPSPRSGRPTTSG
jgi:cytochrome bd-type quinol oxidase subunit 2